MQHTSSLFFGQRLCLVELKTKNSVNSNERLIFSGHGNTVEIYRVYAQSADGDFDKFELLSTLDIFSNIKSSVQKMIWLENDALFCVGERECQIVCLDRIDLKFQVKNHQNLYFDDWIIGAKCVDGTGIVLHFATNSIKLLDLSNFLNIQTKCRLYLKGRSVITCSLLDGNDWESLQIFAGTSLGHINQFWPSKNGEGILRTFEGNNGMPFAIRRHRDWLISVGDDRALRVWTMDGLQIGEIYGHGARPFVLELFERAKMIFTGGIDDYVCIWRWTEDDDHKRIDLRSERRIEFGSNSLGTIQSILPIFKNNSKILDLLISSRMGALVNFRLPLSEVDDHFSGLEPKHVFEFGLNLNAFVVSKSKKCGDFSMLFALDELRQFSVHQLCFDFQKSQWTLNPLTSISNKINSQLLIDDKEFRPDLFIYSQKAELVAVCSQNSLNIIKVFPISQQLFDFFFFRFNGNFAQILWINSDNLLGEDCGYLFSLEYTGKATLYKCNSNVDKNTCCVIFSTFSMLPPTSSRKSFPQSALLISSRKILILGTRSGALLVFSIEQPNGKLFCSLGNAHGTDTVTAIEICKNNNSKFRTIGRDGNVKKWRLNFNEEVDKGKSSLELISFSKLNFEWPCEFIQNYRGRSLIAGFQNNYFVLFDETTNSIVCRKYLVGGGKRLWQLWMKNFLDNDQICLFYAQKGSFYCDVLNPLFLNFVKQIPHSENITALDFLTKDENNFFILSGSLDRKIVCSNFNKNQEFKINSSVQMHRSSVETICVLQENSNFLVLSGGGRSEVFCWELIFEEQNLQPQFNLLFSTELKNENNIDDIRVLCVRWIFGRRQFAVALCSDATIRILQLNYLTKSIVESSRFQLRSMAMFSSINLAGLIEESSQFLFSTTTSGYLFIFKLLILPNGTTKILIHEPYFVEKCGLSAISSEISPFNNHQHFILNGSESGSISILTFDSLLGNVENNIFVNLHASNITALKIWTSSIQDPTLLIASVALDCRLCIGNYIPNKNELIPQIQICLSISDPAALIVLPNRTRKELNEEGADKKGFNCIVSGSGIECINI